MPRIVMKFGGTSMAGIERIRHVAARVRREAEAGNEVLVVVSAMAGETDRLVQFCREAAALYDPSEYDVVVASGEQVTAGLLAMTLQNMGAQGAQLHGLAIASAPPASTATPGSRRSNRAMLDEALKGGTIAVIPGFQGVSDDGRLATLGRGGSDTARSRSPPGSRPTAATSTPTSTGSTPPTRASSPGAQARPGHVRGNARACRGRRQGAADPLGRAGDARENAAAGAVRVRGCARDRDRRANCQERTWNATRSPASPPTRTRRGSP